MPAGQRKMMKTHYGYKAHIKADSDSKLITKYTVTSASVHDSQELTNLIDAKDNSLYADSAYVGPIIENCLNKKNIQINICEKGYRNKPLTKKQKKDNRRKSKTRVRIETHFRIHDKLNEWYLHSKHRFCASGV